jgi:hypothetical protein
VERSIVEKYVVFQITPATAADIACYMAFYNFLNEMNTHAVIRVAADSQLPGRFKDSSGQIEPDAVEVVGFRDTK